MRNNYATKEALVFLTGFAAGSAAGILLAPASGRRTRREVTRTVEDTQDYLADLGEELIEKGQELIQQTENRLKKEK